MNVKSLTRLNKVCKPVFTASLSFGSWSCHPFVHPRAGKSPPWGWTLQQAFSMSRRLQCLPEELNTCVWFGVPLDLLLYWLVWLGSTFYLTVVAAASSGKHESFLSYSYISTVEWLDASVCLGQPQNFLCCAFVLSSFSSIIEFRQKHQVLHLMGSWLKVAECSFDPEQSCILEHLSAIVSSVQRMLTHFFITVLIEALVPLAVSFHLLQFTLLFYIFLTS